MTQTIITCVEARAQGLKHYFTGKPCKHEHFAPRLVSDWSCLECRKHTMRARWRDNPEKERTDSRRRRADPEKANAIRRAWHAANPDAKSRYDRAYRQRYAEKIRRHRAANRPSAEKQREYTARYRSKLPSGRILAWTRNRQAAQLRRTPAWANKAAIAAVYEKAAELTRATGVAHHVDHEVPLQGRLVSGLHVHENLRAVPASLNCRKHNRFVVAA
jgi:hypothetical protein